MSYSVPSDGAAAHEGGFSRAGERGLCPRLDSGQSQGWLWT